MSFKPAFNPHTKRGKLNNEQTVDPETGVAHYSVVRTDGTAFAERLLRKLVKPNPQPPQKFNGPFTRSR